MKKNERQLLKTNGSAESDEYRKLIILIVIIASVFVIFYVLTVTFSKKKDNKDNIFKNDLSPSEIQYKEITIGRMLSKGGKFYVLILEDNEQWKDYFEKHIDSIGDKAKIYTVDLTQAFNKKYIDDYYSYDKDDFKVKGTVLVKIEDHKITEHFETTEGIIEKLKALED